MESLFAHQVGNNWKTAAGCSVGDRERGQEKVPAVEQASGRAARPKLMPSKFSLILLYLGEGEGRERGEAWKAPLRSCSPRSPLPLLSPQLGNRPTNGGSRKYFKTFSHPLSPPSPQFQSLPILPSFPASFTFLIFFRSCRQLFSRKREKNKKVCHDLSPPPPPPWSPDARGRGGRRPRRQPWRRRREKLVRS